ncbi:MAG: hypothetical protein V4772_23845 [Pseudomonadota bacterium]
MTFKTNFSFELQYTAQSPATQEERSKFMASLETSLQQLLAADDADAKVNIGNSHKGNDNKIVEFTSSLTDSRIGEILTAFCAENGVSMSALE